MPPPIVAQRRLAFIGPTNAGKTTAARLTQILLPSVQTVSVASLLRDIQSFIYARIGFWLPEDAGHQNQRLLVSIRECLDHIDSELLRKDFERRVLEASQAAVLVNDDARLAMAPILRELQFTLVWVERQHGRCRSDINRYESTHPQDTTIPRDMCHTVLINTGNIGDYAAAIDVLLSSGSA